MARERRILVEEFSAFRCGEAAPLVDVIEEQLTFACGRLETRCSRPQDQLV